MSVMGGPGKCAKVYGTPCSVKETIEMPGQTQPAFPPGQQKPAETRHTSSRIPLSSSFQPLLPPLARWVLCVLLYTHKY